MEIQTLDSIKDISLLTLGKPSPLPGGGSYYAKILYNNKPIDIQAHPCLTKQGIVSTGTKTYCDLMYDNNEHIEPSLVQVLEQIEERCIQLIYEKKDTWFSSNLEFTDIETAFSSCMRLYKSGKFTLVRTNIPNSKKAIKAQSQNCEVYNQKGENLPLEAITSEVKVIPLIRIDELRFSSKSFNINILLNQCLILDKQEENKKGCKIKLDTFNKESELEVQKENIKELKQLSTNNIILEQTQTENKINHNTLKENKKNNLLKNELLKPNINIEPILKKEPAFDDLQEVDITANTDDEEDELQEHEIQLDDYEEDLEEDEDEEFDGMKVIKNIKINDEKTTLKLKKPDEVYYELYKTAKEKAKQARKEAIALFLEAKSIKAKYMLDEIDESDDEEFYSNL